MTTDVTEEFKDDLDVPVVESGVTLDVAEYEGKGVKIDKVERYIIDSHYVNGEWSQNETQKQHVVEIITEPVTSITLESGEKKDVTVSQRFNLQERVNQKTGEKEIIISKNPNAKLWKFMRKLGVSKLQEIKGKIVTLTTVPSVDPNDDRRWLRIVL